MPNVQITMNPGTVNQLRQMGFALLAINAPQPGNGGTEPTVSSSTSRLSTTMSVAAAEKVLLVFANNPMNTGTVVMRCPANGLLVNLSGVSDPTVHFDPNSGWSFGGAAWARSVPANTPLAPLFTP